MLPAWCNITWINDDFPKTNFSSKNLLIQRLLRYAVGTVYVLNIGFWRSPTSVFEVGFEKNWFKTCKLVPTRPACCGCKHENFLSRKITVRFKLNLKMDGLDRKMIFKFGKHAERLHSTRKQCRRIYICFFCVAKYLLGTPKPLNCIRWMQAWRL